MVEKISPVNPNKCPPVIENSEQNLRDICYNKAHEIYGEDLPEPVSDQTGERTDIPSFPMDIR